VRLRTQYNKVKCKAKYNYRYNEGINISKLAKTNPRNFCQKIKSYNKKKQSKTENLSLGD